MDASELLAARASNGKLADPAPDETALRALLEAALRGPDHGLLRPTRLLLIRGAGRARLGRVLREALALRRPEAAPEELDKEQHKPLRAPLLVVVVCAPKADPKVPEIEQLMSSATVAHGILLGAQARGFAAMWRTGPAAYDAHVRQGLGLAESEQIVGFVYVGSAALALKPIARPRYEDAVRSWGEDTGG